LEREFNLINLCLHKLNLHTRHELTKACRGGVNALDIFLECTFDLEAGKIIGQQSSQPSFDFTVCCLVMCCTGHLFIDPTFTAGNVVQVSLIKTMASIMLAHTTLVTISPRKAAVLILGQGFASLSF
jgi:hypothetical protein